jgi:hypothetical protein
LGTGTFTIASPNSNTDRTLTLPNASGTLNTSGAPNEVPAGSAAAPAIYPTGDTNTGIFFPAADTIAFAEGGAEVARFDASGQLGIGTTNPYSKLDLGPYGSQSQLSWHQDSTTSYGHIGLQNNSAAVGLLAGLKMGASANSFASSISTLWGKTAILLNYGNIQFFTNAPDTVAYGTTYTPTERARIDSSGNLLVGTTSTLSGNKLLVTGATLVAGINVTNGTGEAYRFYSNGTAVGTISVTGSATAYNTSSDYRLKNTITPMTGALARVAALKPCTYKWNADGSDGEGFIAHELAEVVPECVTGEKDAVDTEGKPVYQGIDTSFLVATLTAAIQELKADLDATKAELAALKGQA